MKKLLSALIVTAMIFSCNQPSPTIKNVPAPVDSLISNWTNAWNNHDSVGVIKLFINDALLIDDNLVVNKTSDMATKWIHPNIKVVSRLKTNKLQEWSAANRAGYTGKYEFDVVVNDSVVARPQGVFTVNWIADEYGEWKVSVAHIHSFEEKK